MAKKSIPSCRPGNSRSRTRSSKRCAPSVDRVEGRGSLRSGRSVAGGARWVPRVPYSIARRVMGAWWSSRSSKPSSVRFTGRGKFDSCPLRQILGSGAGVPAAARFGPNAVELRDDTADKARGSPSPPAAGGEGRGEEGHFRLGFPSPRSFLAGRGRRFTLAESLNSMAVLPARNPRLGTWHFGKGGVGHVA